MRVLIISQSLETEKLYKVAGNTIVNKARNCLQQNLFDWLDWHV